MAYMFRNVKKDARLARERYEDTGRRENARRAALGLPPTFFEKPKRAKLERPITIAGSLDGQEPITSRTTEDRIQGLIGQIKRDTAVLKGPPQYIVDKEFYEERIAGIRETIKQLAPDMEHLKRENAIPATPPRPDAEPKPELKALHAGGGTGGVEGQKRVPAGQGEHGGEWTK
jgi:hypothetical protein